MNEINLEDPMDTDMNQGQLADEIIKLAKELEEDGKILALAELAEDAHALELLKGEEKISVAQAEKDALVATKNLYHELKYSREAKIELINAYKKKIEIIGWTYKNQPGI